MSGKGTTGAVGSPAPPAGPGPEPGPPAEVELLHVTRVRLVETAGFELSPRQRAEMDRVWDRAVRANPALFDGPAVALTGLERAGHDELVLSWARATYRHRALRQVPGAPACASLFVSVLQPADDGSVLVGRMSPTTAAPGRWQLPGGTIEPPCAEGALGLADLREHAARELAEETGSGIQAADLAHWLITRGTQGNVGVFFLAPPRPARELRARYATLAEAETARGVDPEFDRIALIGSPADLMDLEGPHVDFLRPVVHRYIAG